MQIILLLSKSTDLVRTVFITDISSMFIFRTFVFRKILQNENKLQLMWLSLLYVIIYWVINQNDEGKGKF